MNHPVLNTLREDGFDFIKTLQNVDEETLTGFQVEHLQATASIRKFCDGFDSTGEDAFARGLIIGISSGFLVMAKQNPKLLNETCAQLMALIAIFTRNNKNILTGLDLK